ncbi:MAG TPA: tyrosine-type recombinase/integrase [Pyrinomonadaceae bacterium]|nr:tyrosine-type recombinase/integrase [Pyrinomonadaceae bacterium]
MQEFPRFLEMFEKTIAVRGLSAKTAKAYLNHFRRFAVHFEKREPLSIDENELGGFLNHLQDEGGFSHATVNQAASAVLFFYREVLRCADKRINFPKRPQNCAKTIVYFTDAEAKAVLSRMKGTVYLTAALIYGSGLRLSEVLNLRVGDIDFKRREIIVRDANGAKQRTTFLPELIAEPLEKHLENVRYIFEDDNLCTNESGIEVFENEWRRQFLFPACKLSKNETTGELYRHHLAESTVQKAINEAIRKAKIGKQACSQTLRRSFAVRLVENKCDVHLISNLLGHKNLKSTLVYTNLSVFGRKNLLSPLDC